MAELINHHVLGDEDSNWGSAIMELGRAEQILNKGAAVQESQQSTLLRLLVSPQQVRLEKDQLPKFAVSGQSIPLCANATYLLPVSLINQEI